MFRSSLRDFLVGGPSSREKYLDKFFQFLSQGYWRLSLATCSQVEASAASLLRSFRGSLRDFLVGGTSSLEKYLSLRLVRDLVQSRKTHILHFLESF